MPWYQRTSGFNVSPLARRNVNRAMTGHVGKTETAEIEELGNGHLHHHSHQPVTHHTPQQLSEELLKRFVQDSVIPVFQEALANLRHDCRKEFQLLSERLRHDLRKEFLQVLDEVAGKDYGRRKQKPIAETDLRQAAKLSDFEKPRRFDRVLNEKNSRKDEESCEQVVIAEFTSHSSHKFDRNDSVKDKIAPRKKPVFLEPDVEGVQSFMDQQHDLVPLDSPPTLPLYVPDDTEHQDNKAPGGGNLQIIEAWRTSTLPEKNSTSAEQADKAAGFSSNGNSDRLSNNSCLRAYESIEDSSPTKRQSSAPKSASSPPRKSIRKTSLGGDRECESERRLIDARKKTARAMGTKGKQYWDMTAEEILTSGHFDNYIGIMILFNAITIGFQTDYLAQNATDIVPVHFSVFEYFFLIVFTSELALRISVYRIGFFTMKKQRFWNWFDTIVVVVQLTEECLLLVARAANWNADSADVRRLTRVLRVLRVMRILRVMRVLHLITELRTIVSSIAGSMRSLLWVMVLLLLMIYIVGVYFTLSVSDHLVDKASKSESYSFNENEEHISDRFGSIGRSILTLYEAMSGGIDWDGVADPMIQEIGWFYGLTIAGYVAFATLALLNVVTGVFVQTALASAKEAEDAFMTEQVITLFKATDRNQSLSLSWTELESTLYEPATAAFWKSIDILPGEAKLLFDLLDTDETEEVEFEQFLWGCLRLRGPAKAMDLLTLMQEQRRSDYKLSEFMASAEERLLLVRSLPEVESAVAHLGCRFDEILDVLEEGQVSMRLLKQGLQDLDKNQQMLLGVKSRMGTVEDLGDTITTVAGDTDQLV